MMQYDAMAFGVPRQNSFFGLTDSLLPLAPSCNQQRGILIGVTRGHKAHVQNHQHAHQQDHVQ